jgi:hypothetical protein
MPQFRDFFSSDSEVTFMSLVDRASRLHMRSMPRSRHFLERANHSLVLQVRAHVQRRPRVLHHVIVIVTCMYSSRCLNACVVSVCVNRNAKSLTHAPILKMAANTYRCLGVPRLQPLLYNMHKTLSRMRAATWVSGMRAATWVSGAYVVTGQRIKLSCSAAG